ncbi:MAG: (2Fe-2S)-binding protein [Alphaproteobacteria bacterium]|jgi:nicotinate dehydrogenase subunit A
MAKISLKVNGKTHEVDCDPETPLIYVLRNQLDLVGAKLGCGLEQCGACAVMVDGDHVLSCVRAASEFVGSEITTVEGLAKDGRPSALQQAFIDEGAAQCGYCTAGLVVAATALLEKNPKPDDAEIREALHEHLCRCGSHLRVLKAIDRVVKGGSINA